MFQVVIEKNRVAKILPAVLYENESNFSKDYICLLLSA